jgi:hypothetical protein
VPLALKAQKSLKSLKRALEEASERNLVVGVEDDVVTSLRLF